jgi:L-histidine Nalpha-methyltransferase
VSPSTALRRLEPTPERDRTQLEVLHGLQQTPKKLPCKLFYDARGSELFERICELEEYYLTRTELGILLAHVGEMADALGPEVTLIEFGSGASMKTRLLLDALIAPRVYVPIDISSTALFSSARALTKAYPELAVRPVCGDYTEPLDLPVSVVPGSVAAFFPGSTIGNFEPPAAIEFLRGIRSHCGPSGKLLIGVDLPKDREVLEAAYDDREGVTAQFNLNILRVMNRDFGAHFALENFAHRALWNERAGRVEMHLVSTRRQSVQVDSMVVHFDVNEHIVTEYCYKYGLDQFRDLARKSGYDVARVWTDPQRRFSVQLLVAR